MSTIESFVSTHLCLAPCKTAKTTDVAAAYVNFNGGSSGKLKLYAHIKAMDGVQKVKQMFIGVELVLPVHVVTATGSSAQKDAILLEIELRRLALEERRVNLEDRKAELEAKKAQDAKEMEARKAELEARKAQDAKDMEARKAELEARKAQGAKELEARRAQDAKELEARISQDAKEMEARRSQDAKEIAEKQIASAETLKAMDLAWEKEKVERQEAEKVRDREFCADQNNKNRKMYSNADGARWNRYLDMKVYGTPSRQYITSDSLFDNFDFRVFDATGKVHAPTRALLRDEIKSASVTMPVWEKEFTRPCEVVEIGRVTELMAALMRKLDASREAMQESFRPIKELLERIPVIASRDDKRFVNTEYERSVAEQRPDKHPVMKSDKRAYIREANAAYIKGGDTRIKCYCCGKDISLKSSACHRSHNVPRSSGGDWSADNVFLCCASCNADMGDRYTVVEYKVIQFIHLLKAMLELLGGGSSEDGEKNIISAAGGFVLKPSCTKETAREELGECNGSGVVMWLHQRDELRRHE